jgi:hypothetical protein
LNYDSCSYKEKLRRAVGPGLYQLDVPSNDCEVCYRDITADTSLRYQNYGHNTCSMKSEVDDSNELLRLNYKNTKCNDEEYMPGKYKKTGCDIKGESDARQCIIPREDTRLSNPPCTLKETGINRWEWICYDPQEKAIEQFDRIPVNYRMVAKDNHVPCVDQPQDQSVFFPNSKVSNNNLESWKSCNQNKLYTPGYPHGSMYPGVPCKN